MEREPEVEEEEEEERLEETIDTNEINRSPMFFARFTPREPKTKRATKSIKNPRGLIKKYNRQTVFMDPENFVEVVKEEIREYRRKANEREGVKKKTEEMKKNTEGLIRLKEMGCDDRPITGLDQVWLDRATIRFRFSDLAPSILHYNWF
jgi:hypothetical protein